MIDPEAYIHPQAIVENDEIGAKTRVYAFVHILPGAVIGSDCNINDHCFIDSDVVLGDRVTVKCFNYLVDGMRVEDDVFLGPSVSYSNDINPRSKRYPDKFERIQIKMNASIGGNSVILGGVTIGRYALVGIGSVVTRDVADHALVYGNPARQHGWVCHCGKRLVPVEGGPEGAFSCGCGNSYIIKDGVVKLSGEETRGGDR